jgi:hypothetical protein
MKALLQIVTVLLALGLYATAQNQYPQDQYPRDQYPQNQPQNQYPDNRGDDRNYPPQGQAQMSPEDQNSFNKEYQKWQESNARHDQDDIDRHARRMEDIMSRNNIPPDTPFSTIATGNSGRYDARDFQGRFSEHDQKEFDKAYEHWANARRGHDRDDIRRDEHRMQDIMARYNIPPDVPYDRLASSGRGY